MNDEIKEILEFIDIRIYPPNSLLFNKWKQLKDYITNLQQENERLKVNCNLGYEELKVARDYKSRCEKASELLESVYMLDNVTITNNACEKIDNAINILQNGSDGNEK